MRIAICLSGQPRTWRRTRESLLAFFAGHELDIYLHTWREGDPAELQALLDAYEPRAARIEPRPLFAEEKRQLAERFPAGPPLPIFDMFHAIAESLALPAETGERYDLVARARFDALFDGAWSAATPPAGSILIPNLFPLPWGCTDQFALGAPSDMQAYGAISGWLQRGAYPAYPEARLHPERLLRDYLETVCSLNVDLQPVAMKLLREAQADRGFAEVVEDPLFHAAKHEAWETFAREQFPDVAARANFDHQGRRALNLERALTAWLEGRPPKDGFQLLKAPWPRRVQAVDAFIREQAGDLPMLDEESYAGVRLLCAMLLQRMAPNEPMNLESWVVHALSANAADMQKAHDWVLAHPDQLGRLSKLAPNLGPLARALTHANPLEQRGIGAWRPR